MRRRLAVLAVALAAVALAAPAATAFFEPGATIVSVFPDRREQADDSTTFAAVAADGGAVVFQTRARNLFADDDPDPPGRYRLGGIFRRDLRSGALALVAHGDLRRESDDALLVRGAQNPSVSADGRFVAFSTGEALAADDDNGRVDAYVRDMALPAADPAAYDLAARKDGGTEPARYEVRAGAEPGRDPGTEVSPGAAISADGRRVVFRTIDVASDLPDRPVPDTPGFQVLVRDRVARTTELVTTTRGPDPPRPAGGALGGARLSADGTTVVWPGQNAQAQTRFLEGEGESTDVAYYLWRRVEGDAIEPTRRITGAADPDDPACPPDGRVSSSPTDGGPCFGPLADSEEGFGSVSATLPALSADGRRVAFLTATPPRPVQTGSGLDLFVTDMSPGVSRKAGTTELTRETTPATAQASGPIQQVALSDDGRRLAFTTARTQFTLPALRLLDGARRIPGKRELYLADLPTGTLERVVRGFDGGDAGDDVGAATTLTADGRTVAFTSPAGNLFFGDANDRPDAFLATRLDAAPAEPPPPDPPLDEAPVQEAEPPGEAAPATGRLAVFVRRAAAGQARLLVRAPSAGAIAAEARGRLPTARARRPKPRRIARASARASKRAAVLVTLKLGRRERAVLRREKRLEAQVTVRFTPRSGEPLTRRIAVVFKAPAGRSKARSKR